MTSRRIKFGIFAFLTIRMEDTTVLDFLRYAASYFISSQQSYDWR